MNGRLQISTWDPRYRDDFVSLNEAWVREFFVMEDNDRKHFDDPEASIIAPGGDIILEEAS